MEEIEDKYNSIGVINYLNMMKGVEIISLSTAVLKFEITNFSNSDFSLENEFNIFPKLGFVFVYLNREIITKPDGTVKVFNMLRTNKERWIPEEVVRHFNEKSLKIKNKKEEYKIFNDELSAMNNKETFSEVPRTIYTYSKSRFFNSDLLA